MEPCPVYPARGNPGDAQSVTARQPSLTGRLAQCMLTDHAEHWRGALHGWTVLESESLRLSWKGCCLRFAACRP